MTDVLHSRLSRRAILATGALSLLSVAAGISPDRAFGQGTAKSKIGIIGSGRIGSTVGELWIKAGHSVMFSSRHPEELAPLVQKLGALAKAGTVAEAVAFGDVAFLAVPYGAYPALGKEHAAALAGKTVLDAGNAVSTRDGEVATEAKANGIGITSAKYFPGAKIVRAFNTLSYRVLGSETNRAGGKIGIPIAGDDKAALDIATKLIEDAGFDAVVIGPLARAKDFAQGAPLYGQQITAQELRQRADALR